MENRCISCGEIIPEGRQVCISCATAKATKAFCQAGEAVKKSNEAFQKLNKILKDSIQKNKRK